MSHTVARQSAPTFQFKQINDSCQLLVISHPRCQAQISLYGGQVLSWIPTGQSEVFWLSENSHFQQPKAIRGGIPLCWPWFGGLDGEGNHGFARNRVWQLVQIVNHDEGVEVILSLNGKQQNSLWPGQFELRQTLFFGNHFSQQLHMQNLSSEPMRYSAALHSYFHVSEPSQVVVPQLVDVFYDDKLSQQKHCLSTTMENCVGPIDRIYHTNETVTLVDQGLQRMITIESEQAQQRVLWNPGAAASTMDDVGAGAEAQFVCLEVADTETRQVLPGEVAQLNQIITLS